MWIFCQADNSHVMSSIISSENYVEHALKMSSAGRDWRFKGLRFCLTYDKFYCRLSCIKCYIVFGHSISKHMMLLGNSKLFDKCHFSHI